MDTGTLFSEYQLQDIVLLSLHFDVSEHEPTDKASITVTIETSETSYDRIEDGLISNTKMIVVSSLESDGKEEDPHMKLRASVVVAYLFTGKKIDDKVETEMRRRSLNEGYAFIRNHIMQLAGLSPMRRLVLPSIEASHIA